MKKYKIENRLWIMEEMISELEGILIQTIQTVQTWLPASNVSQKQCQNIEYRCLSRPPRQMNHTLLSLTPGLRQTTWAFGKT